MSRVELLQASWERVPNWIPCFFPLPAGCFLATGFVAPPLPVFWGAAGAFGKGKIFF